MKNVLNFLFPRYCWICGKRLQIGEKHLCVQCLLNLPLTHYHSQLSNPMEQLFWGLIPIECANAFFFYEKEGRVSQILYHIKYYNHPEVGEYIAETMSVEQLSFFKDIDYVIAVPINKIRKRKRGYNQSDYLARGISKATGIPVLDKVLSRVVSTDTQTRKNRQERAENVFSAFTLHPSFSIDQLRNKHVLLVDDVCTTGATLKAAAEPLCKVPGIRISILSMAVVKI